METKFTLQLYRSNIKKWINKSCSLNELVEALKTEKYIDDCRWFLKNVGTSSEEWAMRHLPMLVMGENTHHQYTGLVVLGLQPANNDELGALQEQVNSQPQTLMSWLDIYHKGLCVVVRCTLPDDSLPKKADQIKRFHRAAFAEAAQRYIRMTDCIVDHEEAPTQTKTVMMSYDQEAFLNEKADTVTLSQPTDDIVNNALLKRSRLTLPPEISSSLPPWEVKVAEMNRFSMVLRTVAEKFPDEEKNEDADEYFTALARQCRAHNVEMAFALKRLMNKMNGLKTLCELAALCFSNVYSADKIPKKQKLLFLTNVTLDIEHYLADHYALRYNKLTDETEYADLTYLYSNWKVADKRWRNSLLIDIRKAGIQAVMKDVDYLLDSDKIKAYHPVQEFLDNLPKWDGKDYITLMAHRVKTDDSLWEERFHTWMLGMVRQWMQQLGRKPMSTCILLIGEPKTFKTTFCRMILPTELQGFYRQNLNFVNREGLMRNLTQYCLVNLDEFDSISKHRVAILKDALTTADPNTRNPYERNETRRPRMAAFIGTTNISTPLSDETGNRRYYCVKVKEPINTSKYVNYPQLYAQILYELKEGRKSFFDSTDEDRIEERNKLFLQTDNITEAFYLKFAKPNTPDETIWLSLTEIFDILNRDRTPKIAFSNTLHSKLGHQITADGFQSKRPKNTLVYAVKKL